MRARCSHAHQRRAEGRSDPWWGKRAPRVLSLSPVFTCARARSVCGFAKNPGQCRTNYSSPGLKQRSGELNIHKVAAAACSRRPASARMQMSRSDARAARLDEDDEMESSTRFRSHSLRLRQRDLDDAPSGRQERDEEVERRPCSLLKRPTEAQSNRGLANHFCRDFRISVRPEFLIDCGMAHDCFFVISTSSFLALFRLF